VKGACDCHVHVFGPASRYPYSRDRAYTPPDASVEDLLALHGSLGVERTVIVQPSPYGTDNSCTLGALRRLGARARGVAVVDPKADLEQFHRAGIRGIRVELRAADASALQEAIGMAKRMGWHVQVTTSMEIIESLHQSLLQLPVPLVVDHFGLPQAQNIRPLADLVRRGRAYVKLSAPHRFPADPAPIARLLAQANPERLLWGSDWPVDDRAALARLAEWFPDANVRRKILVDNPARLYDF
jgi:predicted TIM-barrel fold metal-dependent hydrolase